MKVIVLCAGYATRMGQLTLNTPKCLLPINGTPYLSLFMEEIQTIKDVEDIYVITNDKFYTQLEDWKKSYKNNKNITVINDHTTCNENRLGAIGDAYYVIKNYGIDDDTFITVADNYFDFRLNTVYELFKKSKVNYVVGKEYPDESYVAGKLGVLELDKNGKLISMEEKPLKPKSLVGAMGLYFYTRKTVSRIKEYLDDKNNSPDAPGKYVAWLIGKEPVNVFVTKGEFVDFGSVENYEKIQALEKAKVRK